jgi:hypothetical protein
MTASQPTDALEAQKRLEALLELTRSGAIRWHVVAPNVLEGSISDQTIRLLLDAEGQVIEARFPASETMAATIVYFDKEENQEFLKYIRESARQTTGRTVHQNQIIVKIDFIKRKFLELCINFSNDEKATWFMNSTCFLYKIMVIFVLSYIIWKIIYLIIAFKMGWIGF